MQIEEIGGSNIRIEKIGGSNVLIEKSVEIMY